MAVVDRTPVMPAVANPAALGLGGFALTTFVLSTHNAGLAPDLTWVGLAFFYGGLAQFCAGMWEFKTGNTFGATAFSTYGAFWLALATFVILLLGGKIPAADVSNDLGWFLLSFTIFNTYMLFWSTRTNVSVFLVFLTLEVTEILLTIGFFSGSKGTIQLGGYIGIVTAIVAWYGSAAVVANSMRATPILPVGRPIWSDSAPMMGTRTQVE
jgi:succinate-acetate transporter protein